MGIRNRVLWGSILALAVLGVTVAVIITQFWPQTISAKRLIGTWEGRGGGDQSITGSIGDESFSIAMSLQTESKLQFNEDGTMTWWIHSWGEDFDLELNFPDSNKPESVAYWKIIEANSNEIIINLINAEGSPYKFVFTGDDEFELFPLDPDSADQTLVFHRKR